jgi:uncharacterized protein (TIGR02246 family)
MGNTPSEIPHQKVLQASLSGDINALITLFANDAVLMPPNDATVFGKDEIRSWWEEYFQFFRVTSSDELERDVATAGSQAIERTVFSATIVPKDGGVRIRDDIRCVTIWKQEADGVWKISHQIWNSTKPVGSGTNRYMNRMLSRKTIQRPGS